jgi:hypothetical protein
MMARAWRVKGLTSAERLVLLKFADSADDDGRNSFPSVRSVGQSCELSERAVQYAVARLRTQHWLALQVPGGGRRSVTYCVFPDIAAGNGPETRGAKSAPLDSGEGCNGCTPGVKQVAPQGCKTRHRIKDDPSLIRPVQEDPPNPPRAGGVSGRRPTRAERKRAERMRAVTWGGCPHGDPRCTTEDECIARLVIGWRRETDAALTAVPP